MGDARILVVDDDPDIHALIAAGARERPWHIDSASDGVEGLRRLAEDGPYALVVTDIRMPELDGLELLERIHQVSPGMPVVVMTADSTPANIVRAIRDKAYTYFSKPFSPEAMVEMMRRALSAPDAGDDVEVLSARPDWIALEVRCRIEIADRLVPFLRELQVELPAEEQEQIGTAFRELLLNAIEHGGHLDPELRVEVAYIRLSRAILYYVRDPGTGFSPDALPHAAGGSAGDPLAHVEVRQQAGMRAGGFGMLLTRHIADELIYNERGNQVLLVKYLPGQPGE